MCQRIIKVRILASGFILSPRHILTVPVSLPVNKLFGLSFSSLILREVEWRSELSQGWQNLDSLLGYFQCWEAYVTETRILVLTYGLGWVVVGHKRSHHSSDQTGNSLLCQKSCCKSPCLSDSPKSAQVAKHWCSVTLQAVTQGV